MAKIEPMNFDEIDEGETALMVVLGAQEGARLRHLAEERDLEPLDALREAIEAYLAVK